MKRQAIQTSIKELRDLAEELEKEWCETNKQLGFGIVDGFKVLSQKCLVPIINKTNESDTWRFEK